MRPSELAAVIAARTQRHIEGPVIRPTYVEGSPGIGKTAIVKQAAAALGIGFKTVHGPLMLAEDFGMPNVSGESLSFTVPRDKFPFEGTDCPDSGIMVIDELAQMDVPQQKIMANMFQERELHGYKLKAGWHFVATGNRQQDRAGANRILSHLNDRMTTYELEVHTDDWANWALSMGGVRPEVVAFIHFRPNLLNAFDPNRSKNPTPRAWAEGVSRSIDTVPQGSELETYKGDVGEGPAAEFMAFLQTFRDLPDPDAVLARPDRAEVPSKLNVTYALCGALASRVTAANADALVTYAERLPPEFMVLLIRDAMRGCPEFTSTRAYVRWATGAGAAVLM